jgi:hypothetical protein
MRYLCLKKRKENTRRGSGFAPMRSTRARERMYFLFLCIHEKHERILTMMFLQRQIWQAVWMKGMLPVPSISEIELKGTAMKDMVSNLEVQRCLCAQSSNQPWSILKGRTTCWVGRFNHQPFHPLVGNVGVREVKDDISAAEKRT